MPRPGLVLLSGLLAIPWSFHPWPARAEDTHGSREYSVSAGLNEAITFSTAASREISVSADLSRSSGATDATSREISTYVPVPPPVIDNAVSREISVSADLAGGYFVADARSREVSVFAQTSALLFGDAVSREVSAHFVLYETCPPTTRVLAPRATYLRTNQDPAASGAPAIPVATIGVVAGDSLRLIRTGNFAYVPLGSETGRTIACVFSSSATLLDSSQLARVPGAIAAGTPYVTAPTTIGGLTTDILQDFAFTDSVDVLVPSGANYLFACANDEFYGDNEDPNGDFALTTHKICAAVSGVASTIGPVPGLIKVEAIRNPAVGRIGLNWVASSSGTLEFEVFDVSGRLLRQWERVAHGETSGIEDFELSRGTRGTPVSGLLFIRMRQGSAVATSKVILLAQ